MGAVRQSAGGVVSNGPIEPSADLRAAAKQMREIFVALAAEGFTATEALRIIGYILASGSQS